MKIPQEKYDAGRWLAWLFLLAGLVAAALAWQIGSRLVRQEQAAQLDARAREAQHSLARQIDAYSEVLRGLQAQLAADPALSRPTFQRIAESLELERLPGIQAVGFSARVPAAAGDAFVVRYIEPLERNRAGIGFDQAADPQRRAAVEHARDSGRLAVSERLRLFVAPGDVDGTVFFLPLYDGGRIPTTLAERRQRFSGFVFLALRVDDMLRDVFGPELLDDVAIRIQRQPTAATAGDAAPDPAQLIFDSQGHRPAVPSALAGPALRRQLELPVGGGAWQLDVAAQPQFARQSQAWLPPLAAFAGALAALLAFFFMRALIDARRRAVRSLRASERQLAQIMEAIDDVLWTVELPAGRIGYVSPAVERVYGRPAAAFYRNPRLWLDTLHPDDRAAVRALRASLRSASDDRQDTLHCRVLRPDGTLRWLRHTLRFVADGTPGSGRLHSVASDVTDEYRLQQLLRRSNRALRAIHECDAKIAAAEDEQALLQAICEVVVKAGYRMAWTGLLAADGASIALASIAGESQDYVDSLRQPLAEDPYRLRTIAAALTSGRPVVATDFRQEADLPWRDDALRHGFNSKVALPLVQDGRTIGVFNVYAAETDAFDGEELALLEGLAGSMLAALQALRHRDGRAAAEEALRLRQRAIEASANAIVIANARLPGFPVEYVNPAFERMTGYTAGEIVGRSLRLLHDGDHNQPGVAEIRSIVTGQRAGHATVRNFRKDGTPFWSRVHIAPVRDDAGAVSHFVAAKYDITETLHYQEQLKFQASHDALTGLPNRTLLRDRLAQAIAAAGHSGDPLWVAFLDLDHFKFVNDSLGHSAGDQLLQQIARRLQHALRDGDTVARQGGDEFVLILPGHPGAAPNEQVLQRVMDVVAQPLQVDSHRFYPTCSVGIAAWPADGDDPETLIKHADVAMYRAKETGRSNFQFFTPALNEKALERLRLEADLRQAIARDELLLHYQPQVSLASGRIIGMEALIRWQHPQLGMVPPGRFIALAEETGLIGPIGDWVLRTACRQNKAWQDAGLEKLRVAVNLSARQFGESDLLQSITAILAETGLEPRYLEIELTESLVMADVEHAIGILRALKALGLQLSIDDFGTGYSSLSYLKRFPLDLLKIDQSFVRDLSVDADSTAIVDSIISLAHGLRLQVIAEGVETAAQLAYLRANGCDQIQGYYFSKPLPAATFEDLLKSGRRLEVDGADPAAEAADVTAAT